ncbi:unnamed protein product, partial [Anisakis simplex]|uniref:NOT2_3_5 domain-containing protein n=1 Tax=Anisakis simplex TaxID=6269 RepID=A0A0M3JAR3_ANISI
MRSKIIENSLFFAFQALGVGLPTHQGVFTMSNAIRQTAIASPSTTQQSLSSMGSTRGSITQGTPMMRPPSLPGYDPSSLLMMDKLKQQQAQQASLQSAGIGSASATTNPPSITPLGSAAAALGASGSSLGGGGTTPLGQLSAAAAGGGAASGGPAASAPPGTPLGLQMSSLGGGPFAAGAASAPQGIGTPFAAPSTPVPPDSRMSPIASAFYNQFATLDPAL